VIEAVITSVVDAVAEAAELRDEPVGRADWDVAVGGALSDEDRRAGCALVGVVVPGEFNAGVVTKVRRE
jgi:hypothetical protein